MSLQQLQASAMASAEKSTNTYMLAVSSLSLQQLQSRGFESDLGDTGNRIQAVLDTTPGHRRTEDSAEKAGAGGKVAVQSATRPKPKRRRQQASAVPTRGEITTGWSDLLGEITSSARRVRVAAGGHFGGKAKKTGKTPSSGAEEAGHAPASVEEEADELEEPSGGRDVGELEEEVPVEEARLDSHGDADVAASGEPAVPPVSLSTCPPAAPSTPGGSASRTPRVDSAEPADALSWRSYRIDEEKVPDAVLGAIWRRAVDPKHCMEEVEALARVPRMTVTKREVVQLPAVHDMQYWRAVKTKRRQTRKAHEESETFPPLAEMMRTIFGDATPPQQSGQALHAQMKEMFNTQKSPEAEGPSALQAAEEIVFEAWKALIATKKESYLGVRQKGRRRAFDEGQPWQRGNQPLAEMEEKTEERRLINSRVSRVLMASQTAQFDDAHVQRLGHAHQKVNERCQRKVNRMHEKFVRKQGQLSARLTRRVQRLQMDFQETQDTKVGSILPSVVAWDGQDGSRSARRSSGSSAGPGGNAASADRGETVLQYLQHHRHRAEQERQSHHAIYLQQVEQFQSYLKLLADPNRNPERGELYLSECFRHVLTAGLIIDNAFFVRALQHLEAEDFEKTATVNLLAACCASFGIDLRRYWEHLRRRGLSCLTPRPQTNEARSWEDWAPWNGVRLEELGPMPTDDTALLVEHDEGLDASIKFMADPCPFTPIVPEDTPNREEGDSRNGQDPLAQILQKVALDAVLERYHHQIRRPDWKLHTYENGAGDGLADEALVRSEEMPTGRRPSAQELPLSNRQGQAKTQASTTQTATKPSTPPLGAGKTRPGGRNQKKMPTLHATRFAAEPIGDMPGAPDKDRPRAAAQLPAMTPIAERPMLE